jgi:hypothetical protein
MGPIESQKERRVSLKTVVLIILASGCLWYVIGLIVGWVRL